jgi:SEC-C motif-containing protein
MTRLRDADPCPCGWLAQVHAAPRAFADCCGRWLREPAPDAESLMRSRYTAFVRGDRDYLLSTWHPSTRPASLDLDPGIRWLGLDVRAHRETGPDQAQVEFVARSRPPGGGAAYRMHERSCFLRDGGRWYYVDGVIR